MNDRKSVTIKGWSRKAEDIGQIISTRWMEQAEQEVYVAILVQVGSGEKFDNFGSELLADSDTIKYINKLQERGTIPKIDGDNYCIAFYCYDRENAILVDNQGYDYARYTAVVDRDTLFAACDGDTRIIKLYM